MLGPVGDTSIETRAASVTVPFDNRSRLEDDAFFVDGIHDDILTQLAKISGLKVISRRAAWRWAGAISRSRSDCCAEPSR
jgi:TolB-like protein